MSTKILSSNDDSYELDRSTSDTTGVFGLDGDDTLNLYASPNRKQIHSWGGNGDDLTNMLFGAKNGGTIDKFSHGHHVRGGSGSDTFNFKGLHTVDDIVVGRIEDFNPSSDVISIGGTEITLNKLESGSGRTSNYNWRVVEYDADDRDSATETQQWLLIDTVQGYVFYALDGARIVDGNGDPDSLANQESHFIGAGGGHVVTAAELAALPTVGYLNPVNYVPSNATPDGGVIMNDTDVTQADVNESIGGSSSGDLIAAGLNDDVVNANGGNDYVWGGSGDDTINGGSGDDTLEGGTGNDTLDGGSGADTFAFSSGHGNDVIENFNVNEDQITFNGSIVDLNAFLANSSVVFNSNGAVVTLGAGVTVVLAGLENFDTSGPVDPPSDYNLINGGDGDDKGQTKLKGTSGNDSIDGGTGNDQLLGNDGNDILIGGDGQDTLTGGSGEDVFVLAAGSRDTIKDFSLSDDKIDLTSFVNVGSIDDLTFNEQGDHLRIKVGGSDVSHLEDFLRNGFTIADLTDDHFIFADDTSDPVDPPSDYNLINGGDGDDKGQTKLKGTSGNDSIDGGTGNDQLLGNDGNDILIGGDGQDTLTGGSGEDVFVLAAGSRDTIKDFSLSDDKIDLTSFVNVGSIDDLTFNEQGDHLRIKVGGSDVSHLEDFLRNGFTIADLTDDHFIFG